MASKHCPTCKRPTYLVRSVIVREEIKEGCDACLPEIIQQGHDGAAKYNRDWQRSEYRRDLLQPNDPAFIKEYPKQAGEMYDSETIRKYS